MGLDAVGAQDLPVRAAETGEPIPVKKIDAEAAAVIGGVGSRAKGFADWFVFVRRGGIPDVRARKIAWARLPAGVEEQGIGATTAAFRETWSALARKADLEVRACFRLYAECLEIFGTTDPWFPRDMIGAIEDDDFSPYWLDGMEDPR
jgi:hypothetical protein